ncbi:hypothetical protein B566_EDAN012463 [Ephemera danica]|nr:hypothetical protein B566_EDAN012463 [Ephemera danica]
MGSVLDPGLLVLARYGNSTVQLPDSMIRKEESCLFRGQAAANGTEAGRGQAAVSLCGGVIHELECASEPLKPRESQQQLNNRQQQRRAAFHHTNQPRPPRTVTGGWWRPAQPSIQRRRSGRGAAGNTVNAAPAAAPGRPLFVELAVFVDRDLFRHMAINFPRDTEREVTRVVLAMVNAVQLLYHDPSLGRAVTFVLKRLEVLHSEPVGLARSHDIDRFLSSFCKWQRHENPVSDADPLHWDHAVLLTGLDLYVQLGGGGSGKPGGKLSSQVVGLAPVGGMCSRASSCTVNEGRHFESVYVVAHEIGHNLGMRHDGPMSDNECDPGSFIMSPTLGSGKITWSACSRRYLEAFLEDWTTPPGVCCLASASRLTNSWCRSGRCVARGLSAQQAGYWPERRVAGSWGEWSSFSECASSCLHGTGGLESGSTGIEVAARRCDRPRPENGGRQCIGSDRRYRACEATQICANVPRTSLHDFADEVCGRARDVDMDLLGTGTQRDSSDPVEACSVWCFKRRGGAKNRGWTFPDGTACSPPALRRGFCVTGRCETFSCAADAVFGEDPELCDLAGSRARVANSVVYNILSDPQTWGAWRPLQGPGGQCKSNCIAPGRGLRLVSRECNAPRGGSCGGPEHDSRSIQLCEPEDSKQGDDISCRAEDPDRPCRVACQDEAVSHRFYLVNGEEGWFPFGTDCGRGARSRQAYCVSGKCLRVIPPGVHQLLSVRRRRRSVLPANESSLVTMHLDEETLHKLIEQLRENAERVMANEESRHRGEVSIDFHNPIHVNNPPLRVEPMTAGNEGHKVPTLGAIAWLLLATLLAR